MEGTAAVPNVSQESEIDARVIIAELHQTEKIETVVVTGDFIELGSSFENGEHTAVSAGNEEAQVIELVTVERDRGAVVESGMEVSRSCKHSPTHFISVTRLEALRVIVWALC